MKALNPVLEKLVLDGRVIVTAKLLEAYVDKINFVEKTTGKAAVMKSIKLAIGMQTDKGRKMLAAVIRVNEMEDAHKKLEALGLDVGTQIILDIDQITKVPPFGGKGEWVWSVKAYTAYPLYVDAVTSDTPARKVS